MGTHDGAGGSAGAPHGPVKGARSSRETRSTAKVLTAFVAVGLTGLLLAALGNAGPYARNGGPILFHLTARRGLHVADIAVALGVLVASPHIAGRLSRWWARVRRRRQRASG